MHVGLERWVRFEQCSELSSGELCRSLPTVPVEDCETAIESLPPEVVLDHELNKHTQIS